MIPGPISGKRVSWCRPAGRLDGVVRTRRAEPLLVPQALCTAHHDWVVEDGRNGDEIVKDAARFLREPGMLERVPGRSGRRP